MRKATFSRDDVVAAGLAVVARDGLGQLSARRVADELGSSTAPVYSNFANMGQFAEAVKRRAVRDLLESTRGHYTDDAFLNIGVGVVRFVWEQPAVYAALFLESSEGDYDPGPDFMAGLVAAMAELPELDPLPMSERIIVLKKLALFTHGLATEIINCCGEHCTLDMMYVLMREVGEAVVAHARAGIARDPEETALLEAFWEHDGPLT